MLALAFLGVLILYALLNLWIANYASKVARRRHKNGWLWGFITLVVLNSYWLYQITLPSLVKPYYCENAGFTLYKTSEQWMAENPGETETLVQYKKDNYERRLKPDGYYEQVYHLNQRFDWRISGETDWKNIQQKIETVVDVKTEEVLAKRIDYSWGIDLIGMHGFGDGTCFDEGERSKWVINEDNFRTLKNKYNELGETK